jgi:alpha-2-macroglobulin-like protein
MQQKKLHRILLALSALLILSFNASAQYYADSKEKIYIQTNHVFFKAGETIFFKLYVIKAQDQTPTRVSNVVYTELISPAGTVMQKASFPVQDGYAEGSFDFTEQTAGGIYKIRAYTSWMQNEKETLFFVKEITLQKVLAPRILMKLDFPEKGYGAGDWVNANFSMRNLSDEPIKNYFGHYTVSIGGQEITTQTFKTDHLGKAIIRFPLPSTLTVNDGLLNVKMEYDSYTEAISRSIPIVLNKIDLQFMPEGGILVDGIMSTVAFKALNENGKAADIKGVIKDHNGNTITSFESYHFGMGKFLFVPQAGTVYKAIITSPSNISQQFDLPAAVAGGVVMQVGKERKKITVSLASSTAMEVKLRGSSRNVTYHLQNISIKKGINLVTLDEKVFPAGITQLTLYTSAEIPLAERLVFMNEDQQLQVTITFDKKQYGPREKVGLSIKTSDERGKPVPSNFSLAVLDDKLWTFADDKQDHIFSWLLLSSELKGKIEEPQFYFKKDEPKAVPALDLLMLTHGYRYFDYIEYVVKENTLQYLPDQDNVLSGRILDADKKPIASRVFLINAVPGGKGMEITTSPDGYFFFSDLLSRNSYYLFAQALDKKEKINISVLQNGLGYNPAKAREFKQLFSKPVDFGGLSPSAPANARMMILGEVIPMNREVMVGTEVVVTAFGQTRQAKQLGFSVTTVRANDIAAGVKLQNGLTGKVSGLHVQTVNTGVFADTRISLRGIRSISGSNQPLFVVNGIPMEQLRLDLINPNDISSVTVLKDGIATALYGSRAANGALILETKKFQREKLGFRFNNKYYYASQMVYTAGTGYTAVKKFYVPKYSTAFTEERTDFRETIYWNPVVQTDKNGTASVEFYNSDASTAFRAIAEGIGFNGNLGRAEATYSVQNVLQVDAKIPPYLTAGDKALIPLVIKNNEEEEEEVTITVSVPANFKTGDFTSTTTIKANGSLQLLIPVEAMAAANGILQFTVTSSSSKETVSLPIQAADKGFPVKLTFSGNKSAQHNFAISGMIPGTLTSKLKLFSNLEGQLLDGIESMLREPNGCFEQTSSSTYPNIFILKYLKEAGKSNPEIQKKALDYIESGYKRLIGFETSQDGFEWFGHTPPHEALTAYGLLEFTDMQEFVNVDKAMLDRTKKFLLDRRDGKGTFSLANKGYDQFASVPNKIANIYIVYALIQAGIGKEIQKEYETAIKNALASKDGYQLAMMAIAAHNMKDAAAYKSLLGELHQLETKESLNAETSVVNSRSASLRVETNSLYAIALMKATSPDLGKVAELISKILAEKNYYGYGSTQSTVMALQAIVNYSKLAGLISGDTAVSFIINTVPVSDYSTVKEQVKEGNNTFTVNYSQIDKAVPYGLEVSYSTYTPPNSEQTELQLATSLKVTETKVGETIRMEISATNTKAALQPMAIAKIGIPAGLSAQPWQLKEIMEKNKAAYYEIFDNYVVFYWMGFAPQETKTISLDLKAEVPGIYRAKASTVYLYYTPEFKHWSEGTQVVVKE